MAMIRVQVRPAAEGDVPAITRIYNAGIEDRMATLETDLRDEAERSGWLAARSERYPALVAVDDAGEVLGWGALNPFNPRPAYRHVADFSIYVAREARGRGVGSALLTALIETARGLGYHKLVLAGFPFNEPGVALYRKFGFRDVGIYREQGLLDGRWVDVILMELML
ncbi:MAG: arsinothricin resistance N-acetyltransferase ArsN1 family A [Thermomicrobiales bacterium]